MKLNYHHLLYVLSLAALVQTGSRTWDLLLRQGAPITAVMGVIVLDLGFLLLHAALSRVENVSQRNTIAGMLAVWWLIIASTTLADAWLITDGSLPWASYLVNVASLVALAGLVIVSYASEDSRRRLSSQDVRTIIEAETHDHRLAHGRALASVAASRLAADDVASIFLQATGRPIESVAGQRWAQLRDTQPQAKIPITHTSRVSGGPRRPLRFGSRR